MRAAEATTLTENPASFSVTTLFDGLVGLASVAIAVSGGSDSMALLRLVREWSLGSRCRIVALTVDHGLRVGSFEEAQQVGAWCAALDVPHHVLQWQGAKPTTGIQAKARVARYDLMAEYCLSHGFDALLTAHTLDDQAETYAMRMARTESVAALAGIWPETQWKGVRVLRPLLGQRRAALRQYLRVLGQNWIDDPSNVDPRFERVRVREALHKGDVVGLAARADAARVRSMEIEAEAKAWIAQQVTFHAESHSTCDRSRLLGLPRDIRHMVLARLIGRAGTGSPLDGNEVEDLLQALTKPGRRTLGGALVAARLRDVIVVREAGRISPEWQVVGASGVLDWDRRFRISAPPGALIGAARFSAPLERSKGVPNYVHEACPVVRQADGALVLAHNAGRADISAVLL